MFYLFHGADEFSAREALARLRASDDFGYNQEVFSGAETSLETILAACDTMPFLSEQRLVVVEGMPRRRRGAKDDNETDGEGGEGASVPAAEAASAGTKGKRGKGTGPNPRAFVEGLAAHVAHLPPTTVLVVVVDEALDTSHPLVKAAQQHGKTRLFAPPRGPQLEDWLDRRAKSLGVSLAPDAAALLASEIGESTRLLASELEKLRTYVGAGGTIRVEDVRALSPASRQSRVFDLTDALARRDNKTALALLHELLAAGESPLGIVALTAYTTRSLLQVKSLAERGMRPAQIAQAAGMAPFVVEKSLAAARRFSFAQLEAAHRSLLEIDTALKSSRMTPELALDLLVVEFGGGRNTSAAR
ncbi:MAG TPA: DNA polymerase III subunit delta [Ktedonobacterales bacterium]